MMSGHPVAVALSASLQQLRDDLARADAEHEKADARWRRANADVTRLDRRRDLLIERINQHQAAQLALDIEPPSS